MSRAGRTTRADFEQWLRANGAEPLGAKMHEFLRFRALGLLCIVYEKNRRGGQSFDPALAREAFDAFRARRAMDLTNPEEPEEEVEDWHATGIALMAIGTRAKAGERINLEREAAALKITPERLVRSLKAQRAPVPEVAHV